MVLNFKSMGAKVWIAANCPIPEAWVSRSTAIRITRGAISLSSSSHFALMVYSNNEKPVALPPGCAKVATNPEPTGSTTLTKTIGTVRDACSSGATAGVVTAKDGGWGERDQFSRVPAIAVGIASAPPRVDPQVAAFHPVQFLQSLQEGRDAALPCRIVLGYVHEHADAPHPFALLRARRPRHGRAPDRRNEVPPPHAGHGDFLRPSTRPAEYIPAVGEALGWNVHPE